MKNKILFTMILALAALFVASCDDDSSEGLTRITYYPTLTLQGDDYIYLDKGSTYTEPGYKATLQGTDVSDQVKVTTNLDTKTSGLYTINYVITNADGFSKSAVRYVVVTDPKALVEGIYYTNAASYRVRNGATTVYGASFEIMVFSKGGTTYSVDDLLGGYYCQRAGYGTKYNLAGTIDVAADGTVTLKESYVPGWGDSADGLTGGKFDKDTKTLSWDVVYAAMDFFVTMTKN